MPPGADGDGLPIAREGEVAAFLRTRIERPARVGLYVLSTLGLATTAIGAVLWLLAPSSLALGLVGLGGLLMLLGYVQYRLYRRDLALWPDQAILWDGGIELVLHNGDVRGVSWTEPDLALDLVARKAPSPAGREFLLVWMSEGKIPSVELTEEGFERVQRVAVAHELTVMQRRHGRVADARQTVEIRQNEARRLAATAERVTDDPSAAPDAE